VNRKALGLWILAMNPLRVSLLALLTVLVDGRLGEEIALNTRLPNKDELEFIDLRPRVLINGVVASPPSYEEPPGLSSNAASGCVGQQCGFRVEAQQCGFRVG
jgi:hypothetical protein